MGVENLHAAKKISDSNTYVLASWHQNLFTGIMSQRNVPHVVIVSKSKDAQPVAFTCEKLGHIAVRGSSRKGNVDKGGALAKDLMIEQLRIGYPGAVTIDGPKGPAKEVKSGIIDMARKSGAVIIPYITRAEKYWSFSKSWDQFRIPKPFTKVITHYGTPIHIKSETDFEEFAKIKSQIKEHLDFDEVKVDSSFENFAALSKENIKP